MPRTGPRRHMNRAVPSAGVGLALAAVSAVASPSAAAAATGPVPTAQPGLSPAPARALPGKVAPAHSTNLTQPSLTYVVVPGDTVSGIARRSGTTVEAIIDANRLDPRALIRVGQVLTIPSPVSPTATAGARTHLVAAGDTVSHLAARYGTTIQAIITANALGPNALIRIGQTLTIPGGAGTAPSPAPTTSSSAPTGTTTHRVVAGDTVSELAVRYGTTIQQVISANNLGATAVIRIGQTLVIPTSKPTSSTSSGTSTNLVPNTFLGRTYPNDVVAAANANKENLLATQVPTREQMRLIIRETAIRMGVDPALAQAIGYVESGFNQQAVSPANAIGAMQVIPSSGEWASQLVGRNLNLLDPNDNATAGVAILRALLRAAPNREAAIAGYYQGLGSVTRNGMYEDTKRYVATVQGAMTRFS